MRTSACEKRESGKQPLVVFFPRYRSNSPSVTNLSVSGVTKHHYLPSVTDALSQLQLTLGGVLIGVVFTSLSALSDSVIDVFIARSSFLI